jgi:hypothetical protein
VPDYRNIWTRWWKDTKSGPANYAEKNLPQWQISFTHPVKIGLRSKAGPSGEKLTTILLRLVKAKNEIPKNFYWALQHQIA